MGDTKREEYEQKETFGRIGFGPSLACKTLIRNISEY